MTELMQASRQWATRPADERFLSLPAMLSKMAHIREFSRAVTVPSRKLDIQPAQGDERNGLAVFGPNGHGYHPTNYSFGQLATLAAAPAGYLRTLAAPIAADCINYGLRCMRDVEDVGVLIYKDGDAPLLRAATGPRYGRIWNSDIVTALIDHFGDGVTGAFKVPGEFGKDVPITNDNTTLYASDRDMFVFLADEKNRIEIPNRRDGQSGSLARGFFVWNSEVGDKTFGIGTFLFDYACCNRIVWGAQQYKEVRIRHSSGAPERYLDEVAPALRLYAEGSAQPIVDAIAAAQAKKIDDVDDFLAKRWGKKMAATLQTQHMAEEERPIESLWDVSTALTAVARDRTHQDARVDLERQAGEILDLAA